MAFHAQKQETTRTPQPRRAETHFLGSSSAPDTQRPQSITGAPHVSHPHAPAPKWCCFLGSPVFWRETTAHQTLQKGGPVTRTQQGRKLQHDKPHCKNQVRLVCQHPSSKARALTLQKGFRTPLMDTTAGKSLLQGRTIMKPPSCPAGISLVPGCSLYLPSGCRAERGRALRTHRHMGTCPPWKSTTRDNSDARKRPG